jgi:hypothetical protein
MRSGTKNYGLDSAGGNAVGERWNPVAVRSYYLCEIRRVVFPPFVLIRLAFSRWSLWTSGFFLARLKQAFSDLVGIFWIVIGSVSRIKRSLALCFCTW